MQWTRDYTPEPDQARAYRQALIITLAGNILLAGGKALATYLSGSIALYADTANSVSDVIYTIAMVFGLWLAQQPPDLSHPQGHSRFEPLVGLVVSVMMGIAGYEALRASIERFITGGEAIGLDLPTLVLLVSAAVKAGMFFTITKLAQKTESPTLRANAQSPPQRCSHFYGGLHRHSGHPVLSPHSRPGGGAAGGTVDL